MDKGPLKAFAGFSSLAGLVLLLLVTFNLTQSSRSANTQARANNVKVNLLSENAGFTDSRTILIDFSKTPCCKTLAQEYIQEGVVFDREPNLGWSTYQADGFINHLSLDSVEPGAPLGITGTRLSFTEPVKKLGLFVQSGSPYNNEDFRSAESITVKAYNEENELIFFEVTDTCLGVESSCRPKFVGVESNRKAVKYFEIIMNEPKNWSADDLQYEL